MIYESKSQEYFKHNRSEIAEILFQNFLLGDNVTVLDIGCGNGNFFHTLKSKSNINYIGIDQFQNYTSDYTHLALDVNTLELKELEQIFTKYKPSIIILNDVLEHLVNPEGLLENLSKLSFNFNFKISISVPNIRFFPILKHILLDGDFLYAESGVLDNTHLRFFTKKSIERIFHKYNFCVLAHSLINIPKSKFLYFTSSIIKKTRFSDIISPQLYYLIQHDDKKNN